MQCMEGFLLSGMMTVMISTIDPSNQGPLSPAAYSLTMNPTQLPEPLLLGMLCCAQAETETDPPLIQVENQQVPTTKRMKLAAAPIVALQNANENNVFDHYIN